MDRAECRHLAASDLRPAWGRSRLTGARRPALAPWRPEGRRPFDEWLKDAAPSDELRRWYGHAPERFDEFARRYRAELGRAPAKAAVGQLLGHAREEPLVLVTATRDLDRSGARVLAEHLQRRVR